MSCQKSQDTAVTLYSKWCTLHNSFINISEANSQYLKDFAIKVRKIYGTVVRNDAVSWSCAVLSDIAI